MKKRFLFIALIALAGYGRGFSQAAKQPQAENNDTKGSHFLSSSAGHEKQTVSNVPDTTVSSAFCSKAEVKHVKSNPSSDVTTSSKMCSAAILKPKEPAGKSLTPQEPEIK